MRQKLKISSSSKKRSGPDFLCIGSQRAGTTWLHRMLLKHPHIFVTPIKELHYFDNVDAGTGQIQLEKIYNNDLWSRPFYDKERYFRNREKFLKKLISLQLSYPQIYWYLKFYASKTFNLKWYQSLFPINGQVRGELTPAYSILDERVIQKIRSMNAEIKIIYILRNPLDRFKSAIRNNLKKRKIKRDKETVIKFIKQQLNNKRSYYYQNLERFYKVFPKEQILVLFFEEMTSSPQQYLKKITSFLEVDTFDFQDMEVNKKVNSNLSVAFTMPTESTELAINHFLPELYKLKQLYPSEYIDNWILELEGKLLNAKKIHE